MKPPGADARRTGARPDARSEKANSTRGAQRGRDRRRGEAPASGPKRDESRSAGLAPEDILAYVERGEGRRPRPFRSGSTLPPKSAACGKARTRTEQELRAAEGGL